MGNGFKYSLAGMAEIIKLGFGVSGAAAFAEMAVGTGTTTPTETDPGLVSEVYRAPFIKSQNGSYITCSLAVPDGVVTVDTPITELAIMNAHTGGVSLCREVRNPVIIGANTGAVFAMKPFLVARQVA